MTRAESECRAAYYAHLRRRNLKPNPWQLAELYALWRAGWSAALRHSRKAENA